jgi:hypothetical protein
MDERLSKSKRKSSKSAHPSQEEKEAMTASLEKARLKEVRPAVQPTPLEPPSFEPPAKNLGTAAPTAFPDAAAAQVNYNYGDRYGGVQPTRYNSTAVDDQENDARADYIYQQRRHVGSATRLRRVTRPISRPPSMKPTHMAKAIVRPQLRRERTHRQRWTGCRRFWRASSVPRTPHSSPSSRLSVRLSFIDFFDIFPFPGAG